MSVQSRYIERPKVILAQLSTYLRVRQSPPAISQILLAFIILVVVVAAWTINSILHPRVENSDLNNVAVMVAKDLNPTLFPTDFTFSDQQFYQAYTPFYRQTVGYLWQWAGNFERGLVWLVPVLLIIFLVGLFVLLYQVTGNTWLAVGLCVASAHYHDMMGAEVWGIGGTQQIQARAFFMAVTPYLALWFFFTMQNPSVVRVTLMGLLVGLAANLHPGSGMHLSVLLASTLILVYGFRRESLRVWAMIPAMMLATLAGAWPMVNNFTGNVDSQAGASVPFEIFRQAVFERYPLYFYPNVFNWYGLEIARPILDVLAWLYLGGALVGFGLYLWGRQSHRQAARWWRWAWLIGGLVSVGYAYMIALFEMGFLFALVGFYVVYRFIRPTFKFLDWLLIGMIAIVIMQSFVGFYLMTLAWDIFQWQGLTPLLIEQFRAARFVYLPVYMLAGLAAVALVTILNRWVKKQDKVTEAAESPNPVLGALVGLFLSLLPGLSNLPGWGYFLAVGLLFAGGLTFYALLSPPSSLLPKTLTILLIIFTLFGPLAPWVAPIAPIPAVNLLNPANRVPQPPWSQSDAEFFQWARENTASDALFFWCSFGPSTTMRFRREAQRGITHNWKDLGWATYNGTTLVPLLERYRKLERACHNTDHALAVAYDIGADYIFVPTGKAVELKTASCFVNDRYIVFGLGANACTSK